MQDKVQIFEVQTINANNQSKNLQIPITNKRVKRALNKQRKKRQKQELEEILQAREELHKRIDHNLKVQQLHQDRVENKSEQNLSLLPLFTQFYTNSCVIGLQKLSEK